MILARKSSVPTQTSDMATKGNKKGFLHISKSINPTASSPLLNDAIKEQIVLYTKLFLIMGLSWIFEILEPLILQNRNDANDEDCNILVSIIILSYNSYFKGGKAHDTG